MNTETRLKRLEKRIRPNQRPAVMFSIGYYDDPAERTKARNRLLEEYLRLGTPIPEMCIWLCEIPAPSSEVVEEKFLGTFLSKA